MQRYIARVCAGVPGIVLFACLFLPATKGCSGKVEYPYDYPMFCSPYVLGLLVALALLPIGLRELAIFIRGVLYPSAIALGLLGLADFKQPAVALYLLAVAAASLALTGFGRCNERSVARGVVGTAVLCLGWFVPWLVGNEALYGMQVAATASLFMLLGGATWWIATHAEEDGAAVDAPVPVTEAELPLARLVAGLTVAKARKDQQVKREHDRDDHRR